MKTEIRSTTIIGVRHKRKVAMAGDGQVTFGEMMFKQKAVRCGNSKQQKTVCWVDLQGLLLMRLHFLKNLNKNWNNMMGILGVLL